MFYAINYHCGVAVNSNGSRYGNYLAFDTSSARDEWVSEGADSLSSSGYREPIKTSDPELRSRLRQADRLMAQGQGHEGSLYEANIELA